MKDFDVIAVGAGPGGISLAIECIEHGIESNKILILEKGPQFIDAIRKFYPDKKMTIANYKNLPVETHGHLPAFPELTKAQTIDYFEGLIKRYELNIRYNAEVYRVQKRDDFFDVLYAQHLERARFVGIGIGILGRPNKPAVKIPLNLRSKCVFDITSQKVSGKILIVGGGDTSSEYAVVLQEEGCDVTLICRSKVLQKMMPQNAEAVQKLVSEGKLKLSLETEIKEIVEAESLPLVHFTNPSLPSMTCDFVVFAIGGSTPLNFLRASGILCEGNWPEVGTHGETNIPGLYLLGDLVAGKTGGSIITAYNASYRAAQAIVAQKDAIV